MPLTATRGVAVERWYALYGSARLAGLSRPFRFSFDAACDTFNSHSPVLLPRSHSHSHPLFSLSLSHSFSFSLWLSVSAWRGCLPASRAESGDKSAGRFAGGREKERKRERETPSRVCAWKSEIEQNLGGGGKAGKRVLFLVSLFVFATIVAASIRCFPHDTCGRSAALFLNISSPPVSVIFAYDLTS